MKHIRSLIKNVISEDMESAKSDVHTILSELVSRRINETAGYDGKNVYCAEVVGDRAAYRAYYHADSESEAYDIAYDKYGGGLNEPNVWKVSEVPPGFKLGRLTKVSLADQRRLDGDDFDDDTGLFDDELEGEVDGELDDSFYPDDAMDYDSMDDHDAFQDRYNMYRNEY